MRTPGPISTAGLVTAGLVNVCLGAAAALAPSTATAAPPASATASGVAACDGQAATIVGTEGPDELVGTDGRDVIAGLGGDDQIRGGGRGDVICGGSGDDRIRGEAGNDRLLGEQGDDRVQPGKLSDVTVWRAGDGSDVLLGHHRHFDALELHGTASDDSFAVRAAEVAGHPAEQISHQDGGGVRYREIYAVNTWLGEGADTYQLAALADYVTRHRVHADVPDGGGGSVGDEKPDVLAWRGSRGPDFAYLTNGISGQAWLDPASGSSAALISTEVGDRVDLDGRGGRDVAAYFPAPGPNHLLVTQHGPERLLVRDALPDEKSGLPVLDRMISGFARLSVVAKGGADDIDLSMVLSTMPIRISGGPGDDTLLGSPGSNRFRGSRGEDTAYGGPGRDRLEGGDHDDRLFGGRGDDVLGGRSFAEDLDECTGGPGRDVFVACETEHRDAADPVVEGLS